MNTIKMKNSSANVVMFMVLCVSKNMVKCSDTRLLVVRVRLSKESCYKIP
jgi:hypothetical protein